MGSGDRQGKSPPKKENEPTRPGKAGEGEHAVLETAEVREAAGGSVVVTAEEEGKNRDEAVIAEIEDPNSEESRIADEFLRKWQAGSGLVDVPFEFQRGAGASPAEEPPAEGEPEDSEKGRKKKKGGLLERLQGEGQKKADSETRIREMENRLRALGEEIRKHAEKIESQENLLQKHYEARLRVQADFENYKKRVIKEKEEIIQFGNERLMKDVLPFIDNLERAMEHARSAGESGPLVDGVKITLNQIFGTLKRHGVEPFESVGQPFDPQRHEAMAQKETADSPPNTVLEQYQRGYVVGKRLLRPAMVSVAKPPAPPPAVAVEPVTAGAMIEATSGESGSGVEGASREKKTDRIPILKKDEGLPDTASAVTDPGPASGGNGGESVVGAETKKDAEGAGEGSSSGGTEPL